MNTSKRNHYLPKFYLHNFVKNYEKNIFWVYYKGNKDPRPQSPINTGVEKNLYTVKRADGLLDDRIEKYLLSPIEGKVKPIIDKLITSNSRLENNELTDLAFFLSLMATRTPRSIQINTEIGETLSVSMLKDFANKPDEIHKLIEEAKQEHIIERDITVEELRCHLNDLENRYKISFSRKYATGVSLRTAKTIFKYLLTMNCCLCKAPSNMYFITSDSPLVCFVLNNDGSAIFNGGYGLPNAEITFPLSPNKCLLLDKKHKQPYRAISNTVLKEINKRTAWAAEKFIISHIKSKHVKALNDWASESINFPKINKRELLRRWAIREKP